VPVEKPFGSSAPSLVMLSLVMLSLVMLAVVMLAV